MRSDGHPFPIVPQNAATAPPINRLRWLSVWETPPKCRRFHDNVYQAQISGYSALPESRRESLPHLYSPPRGPFFIRISRKPGLDNSPICHKSFVMILWQFDTVTRHASWQTACQSYSVNFKLRYVQFVKSVGLILPSYRWSYVWYQYYVSFCSKITIFFLWISDEIQIWLAPLADSRPTSLEVSSFCHLCRFHQIWRTKPFPCLLGLRIRIIFQPWS